MLAISFFFLLLWRGMNVLGSNEHIEVLFCLDGQGQVFDDNLSVGLDLRLIARLDYKCGSDCFLSRTQ